MVIMTNDSPMGEPPNEIIADMVAGYPDRILKRNASVPYQPGFLQDPAAWTLMPWSFSGTTATSAPLSHTYRLQMFV